MVKLSSELNCPMGYDEFELITYIVCVNITYKISYSSGIMATNCESVKEMLSKIVDMLDEKQNKNEENRNENPNPSVSTENCSNYNSASSTVPGTMPVPQTSSIQLQNHPTHNFTPGTGSWTMPTQHYGFASYQNYPTHNVARSTVPVQYYNPYMPCQNHQGYNCAPGTYPEYYPEYYPQYDDYPQWQGGRRGYWGRNSWRRGSWKRGYRGRGFNRDY